MQRYVSYLRVSTARQGGQGLGIEAQREAVRQYIAGVGGNLITEHVEVETGRLATRPILLEAIAQCRRERSTLVIARLDRLARSVSFISSLMEGGVDFVAVDMPTANKLMLHMLAAFAEFERDQIAARTKAALAAAKSRGVVLGRNGRVLAEAHKAAAINFTENLRGDVQAAMSGGAVTLRAISECLNGAGKLTREGCRWTPGTVQHTMRRLGLSTPAMMQCSTVGRTLL